MAVGLPIACSKRSSLPETLQDGGVYFDPEEPDDIAKMISFLIDNPVERLHFTRRAKQISRHYSWDRCSYETFHLFLR